MKLCLVTYFLVILLQDADFIGIQQPNIDKTFVDEKINYVHAANLSGNIEINSLTTIKPLQPNGTGDEEEDWYHSTDYKINLVAVEDFKDSETIQDGSGYTRPVESQSTAPLTGFGLLDSSKKNVTNDTILESMVAVINHLTSGSIPDMNDVSKKKGDDTGENELEHASGLFQNKLSNMLEEKELEDVLGAEEIQKSIMDDPLKNEETFIGTPSAPKSSSILEKENDDVEDVSSFLHLDDDFLKDIKDDGSNDLKDFDFEDVASILELVDIEATTVKTSEKKFKFLDLFNNKDSVDTNTTDEDISSKFNMKEERSSTTESTINIKVVKKNEDVTKLIQITTEASFDDFESKKGELKFFINGALLSTKSEIENDKAKNQEPNSENISTESILSSGDQDKQNSSSTEIVDKLELQDVKVDDVKLGDTVKDKLTSGTKSESEDVTIDFLEGPTTFTKNPTTKSDKDINEEPLITGVLFNKRIKFGVKISNQDSSFYVPPDAHLRHNIAANLLNITWKSSKSNLNNSLSFNMTRQSKNYAINGIELNIVRGNDILMVKKVLPQLLSFKSDKTTIITLDDNIQMSIFNLEFLKIKPSKGPFKANIGSSSGLTDRKMLHIEIILGISTFVLLISIVAGLIAKKRWDRMLKLKNNADSGTEP